MLFHKECIKSYFINKIVIIVDATVSLHMTILFFSHFPGYSHLKSVTSNLHQGVVSQCLLSVLCERGNLFKIKIKLFVRCVFVASGSLINKKCVQTF